MPLWITIASDPGLGAGGGAGSGSGGAGPGSGGMGAATAAVAGMETIFVGRAGAHAINVAQKIADFLVTEVVSQGAVLLFKKAFFEGLVSGAVTLTFRRWQKPHVKPGGRYRCHPIGVLEVSEVALVPASAITDDDATRAGFATLATLIEYLKELGPLENETTVYRVVLRHAGDGDRVSIALEDTLSREDVLSIKKKLAAMDERADKPWTKKTMAIIDKNPRIAASQLAKKLGRETLPFKEDVRKLKKLGLTQSFEVGYEIAPRGRAYLTAVAPKKREK